MANSKKKVYVVMLNTPRLGIQLLGTFASKDEADSFIADHKAFLNAEYENVKKLLSVSYQLFTEVVSTIEESNAPKDDEAWTDHVKALLADKFPQYEYDKFVADLKEGRKITRLEAMSSYSTYTVYETALGEAKHQLPKNL